MSYEGLEFGNLLLKAENEWLKKELAKLHVAYSEYEQLGVNRNDAVKGYPELSEAEYELVRKVSYFSENYTTYIEGVMVCEQLDTLETDFHVYCESNNYEAAKETYDKIAAIPNFNTVLLKLYRLNLAGINR